LNCVFPDLTLSFPPYVAATLGQFPLTPLLRLLSLWDLSACPLTTAFLWFCPTRLSARRPPSPVFCYLKRCLPTGPGHASSDHFCLTGHCFFVPFPTLSFNIVGVGLNAFWTILCYLSRVPNFPFPKCTSFAGLSDRRRAADPAAFSGRFTPFPLKLHFGHREGGADTFVSPPNPLTRLFSQALLSPKPAMFAVCFF